MARNKGAMVGNVMVEAAPIATKKSYCVVLLCGESYLFPSLVAAKTARRHVPANTDIFVFVGTKNIETNSLEQMEKASGVSIRLIPPEIISLLETRIPAEIFPPRYHVPLSATFRFFIADLLDRSYERILYLDGDIQIRRSLAPLLQMDLPQGHVAAVPDWWALHMRANLFVPAERHDYYDGLGLSHEQRRLYFNSGVMLAAPDTWAEIGAAALNFMIETPFACKYQDQSALNNAARDRITNISVRWNYLRAFMALPVRAAIDPAVLHFTGRPKPWDGVFPPWSDLEWREYVDMARAMEGAGVNWRRQSALRRLGYRLLPLVSTKEFGDPLYRKRIEDVLLLASKDPLDQQEISRQSAAL